MSIELLTRADDFGSSHAANRAIFEGIQQSKYIKNVSVMAPAPMIEEAAELAAKCDGICFGMHATINAEWDLMKWMPILPAEEVPHLVDSMGAFIADPAEFAVNGADSQEVIKEYDAQLETLFKLGFDITYADTHMFPLKYISGLREAFDDWTAKKGLINQIYYYRMPMEQYEPKKGTTLEETANYYRKWISYLKEGLYFSVMHPAKNSREMLLCRNKYAGEKEVAFVRDMEYQMLVKRIAERICTEHNITTLRYDEAKPQEDVYRFMVEVF